MRLAILLILSLFLAPLAAFSATEGSLSLDEAVEIGLAQHYSILGAREELVRLEGQIEEVRSTVLPQVGLEASISSSYDESSNIPGQRAKQRDFYQAKLTGSQLLYSWGKATSAIEAAKIERQRSGKEMAATELGVKLAIHESFYDLMLAHKLLEVSQRQVKQREEHLEVARKRFEAGVATEFEVIRSRAQLANAQLPLIEANNRIRQAEAMLNQLLGRSQGTPIAPAGELGGAAPTKETTLDELVNRAVANRPELQALKLARTSSEKQTTIYDAQNMPEFYAFGEYGYGSETAEDLGEDREQWRAGVNMSFPFFDGLRTRAKVAQAMSTTRSIDISIKDLEQQIAFEARLALDSLAEAVNLLGAAKASIKEAERALEMARISFENGVATTLDVTDAELGLIFSLTNEATALRDLMASGARVLAVAGEL